jgi:hypothetical protein
MWMTKIRLKLTKRCPIDRFFEIGLEKDMAPVYLIGLHESLWSWNINQTSLQKHIEGLTILNRLQTDSIIENDVQFLPGAKKGWLASNDSFVVALSSHKFAVFNVLM